MITQLTNSKDEKINKFPASVQLDNYDPQLSKAAIEALGQLKVIVKRSNPTHQSSQAHCCSTVENRQLMTTISSSSPAIFSIWHSKSSSSSSFPNLLTPPQAVCLTRGVHIRKRAQYSSYSSSSSSYTASSLTGGWTVHCWMLFVGVLVQWATETCNRLDAPLASCLRRTFAGLQWSKNWQQRWRICKCESLYRTIDRRRCQRWCYFPFILPCVDK